VSSVFLVVGRQAGPSRQRGQATRWAPVAGATRLRRWPTFFSSRDRSIDQASERWAALRRVATGQVLPQAV